MKSNFPFIALRGISMMLVLLFTLLALGCNNPSSLTDPLDPSVDPNVVSYSENIVGGDDYNLYNVVIGDGITDVKISTIPVTEGLYWIRTGYRTVRWTYNGDTTVTSERQFSETYNTVTLSYDEESGARSVILSYE